MLSKYDAFNKYKVIGKKTWLITLKRNNIIPIANTFYALKTLNTAQIYK